MAIEEDSVDIKEPDTRRFDHRITAKLDVKGRNLVKGVQLEGLRKLGNPNEFARTYYSAGVDELFYEDVVASLYERNSLLDLVQEATQEIFIPITVGGGIKNLSDVEMALKMGADKVAINTQAVRTPQLITEIATEFGSQCMVLSIQAKKKGNFWEAFIEYGREPTGLDVESWAKRAQELGAGEIILTSVDRDGTLDGFDSNLIRKIRQSISIPLVAGGGFGTLNDIDELLGVGNPEAFSVGRALHESKVSVSDIKNRIQSFESEIDN